MDLSCGTGRSTRVLQDIGFDIIGVDISKNMINLAQQEEAKTALGIEYLIQDVTKLASIGYFDIVMGIYLFPYASTQPALQAMCQAVYNNLKPGGRAIAITMDPNLSNQRLSAFEKYGVSFAAEEQLQDGTTITAVVEMPGGDSVDMMIWHWQQETYENILRQVGFRKIVWHLVQVSEAGLKAYGADYWQAYASRPYGIILECYK